MTLPTKFKTIPFVSGVDMKTDDKAVQGKLLTCKNLVFSSPGIVKKRNSFKQYSFAPQESEIISGSPVNVFEVQNTNMVTAYGENLYTSHSYKHYRDNVGSFSFDENSGSCLAKAINTVGTDIHQTIKTPYLPMEVSRCFSKSGHLYTEPNIAVDSSYVVVVWHSEDSSGTPNHEVLISIVDRTSDRVVLDSYSLASNTGVALYRPRVFIDGTYAWVWYSNGANIYCSKITLASTYVATGTVISDLFATYNKAAWDITESTWGSAPSFAIAYKKTGGNIKLVQTDRGATYTTLPAIVDSVTSGLVNNPPAVCVFEHGTKLIVCFDTSSTLDIYESPKDPLGFSGLAAITPPGNLIKLTGVSSPETMASDRLRAGSPPPVATDLVNVFFETDSSYPNDDLVCCYTIDCSTGEAVYERRWTNATIITKPFVYDNKVYIALGKESTIQGSINICCMSYDETLSAVADRRTQSTVSTIDFGSALGNTDTMSEAVIVSDDMWFIHINNTLEGTTTEITTTRSIFTDFHSKAYENNVYSGKPYIASVGVEQGFCQYPDIRTIGTSATGGSMSDGSYFVTATYEYTDELGDIHISAPSAVENIVLSGGSSIQYISVEVMPLTFGSPKKLFNTTINVYRTINLGTTYYLAKTVKNYTPSVSQGCLLKIDDTELQTKRQLYTSSGLILDNICPPMANIALETIDRIYLVNSLKPSEIWFSKPFRPTVAPEFNDSFVITISGGGDTIGLADMRGSVVVIKEESIYVFSGEGPGADGRGTFGQPQLISNRGCISPESILQTDYGIYYQTANGIYLISMDFSVKYVGGQVEDYNSYTVVGAVHMQDQNQARFMLDDLDNTILVHDYQMDQWATFTDDVFAWSIGQSANWDDKQIMCDSLATCYMEDPGNTTSAPFELTTEWIQMADWEGYQRIREVHVLGTYKGQHGLSMTSYRDYDSSKNESKSWIVDSDPGTYALRTTPKYQKCRAMKIKLTDSYGMSVDYPITGLSFGNAAVSPNGIAPLTQTNLYDFIAAATTGTHIAAFSSFSTVVIGDDYCLSVIAKKSNKNWIYLSATHASGAICYSYYDLDNKVVGSYSGCVPYICDLGSDYMWCIITINANYTTLKGWIYGAEADGDLIYTGNGSTVDMSISRYVLEKGIFPSPIQNSVELNGLRIGYGVKRAMAKSRSSST